MTISVDAVVYYQVSNPLSAICNNDDYNRSTRLLAQTTLRFEWKMSRLYRFTKVFLNKRNILGTKNLSEILSDRETIGEVRQTFKNIVSFKSYFKAMHHNLEVATDPWGVHVERVEIKVDGGVQK